MAREKTFNIAHVAQEAEQTLHPTSTLPKKPKIEAEENSSATTTQSSAEQSQPAHPQATTANATQQQTIQTNSPKAASQVTDTPVSPNQPNTPEQVIATQSQQQPAQTQHNSGNQAQPLGVQTQQRAAIQQQAVVTHQQTVATDTLQQASTPQAAMPQAPTTQVVTPQVASAQTVMAQNAAAQTASAQIGATETGGMQTQPQYATDIAQYSGIPLQQTPFQATQMPIQQGFGQSMANVPLDQVPTRFRGRKKVIRTIPKTNGKTLYFDAQMNKQLREVAWNAQVDMQDIVRVAVKEFIDNYSVNNELNELGRTKILNYVKATSRLIE